MSHRSEDTNARTQKYLGGVKQQVAVGGSDGKGVAIGDAVRADLRDGERLERLGLARAIQGHAGSGDAQPETLRETPARTLNRTRRQTRLLRDHLVYCNSAIVS